MSIVLAFVTAFIIKYFTGQAIEKIILILLKKMVESTSSNIDNEIYDAVFKKVENSKIE